MIFSFAAAGANTGAATLNIDSVGAKAIKKFTSGSEAALSANDIVTSQIVTVVYDSSLDSSSGAFVMVSTLGQQAGVEIESIGTITTAASNVGASDTSENTMSPTWTGANSIPGGTLAVGSTIHFEVGGNYRLDAGSVTIRVKLGGSLIGHFTQSTTSASAEAPFNIKGIIACRSTGASGSLSPTSQWAAGGDAQAISEAGTANGAVTPPAAVTLDTTGSLALTVTAQFGSSDAQHLCNMQNGSIVLQNAPS